MELQLKNIGMIKEANVMIDGLTVIAGENDTGKSTLSKAIVFGLTIIKRLHAHNSTTLQDTQNILTCTRIFDVDILKGINVDYLENAQIDILIEGISVNPMLGLGVSSKVIIDKIKHLKSIPDTVFVETPTIWSFLETFKDIAQISQQVGLDVKQPYLMNDLSIKLSNRSIKDSQVDISQNVKKIMDGEFKKDDRGLFYFEKDKSRIELINTATGIKSFGILQILSENGWLGRDNIIILDEPEVHLHPKWQLEMAKVIVELVKNGVKVLVNSHSPYMIEALERYGEKADINMDFYLAEDGIIDKVEDSNSLTLAKIFKKLSQPFETFNEMDSEILQGG